jgi:hypothetical protein
VFTFLFSKPSLLRELYSAIEGIALPTDTPIDINTLSDVLFMERIVHAYNINHGHNPEILKKSGTLNGYSIFVGKVREYLKKEESLEKALPSAVKYCIDNNILVDFFREHGSEAHNYARRCRADE